MSNLDDFKKRLNNSNKYLICRLIIYFFLITISISSMYHSKITNQSYFNNIILFSAPLAIEYYFGIDCYTEKCKNCKTWGFIISSILFFIGVLGVTGLIYLSQNNSKIVGIGISYIDILPQISNILLFIIRCLPYILFCFILGDCYFSLSIDEVNYHNKMDKLSKDAQIIITEDKKELFEKEKKKIADYYKEKLNLNEPNHEDV